MQQDAEVAGDAGELEPRTPQSGGKRVIRGITIPALNLSERAGDPVETPTSHQQKQHPQLPQRPTLQASPSRRTPSTHPPAAAAATAAAVSPSAAAGETRPPPSAASATDGADPSRQRHPYGAWYVPPREWKTVYAGSVRRSTGSGPEGSTAGSSGQVHVPEGVEAMTAEERASREAMALELGSSYTTRAYKEHLKAHNLRPPGVLERMPTPSEDQIRRHQIEIARSAQSRRERDHPSSDAAPPVSPGGGTGTSGGLGPSGLSRSTTVTAIRFTPNGSSGEPVPGSSRPSSQANQQGYDPGQGQGQDQDVPQHTRSGSAGQGEGQGRGLLQRSDTLNATDHPPLSTRSIVSESRIERGPSSNGAPEPEPETPTPKPQAPAAAVNRGDGYETLDDVMAPALRERIRQLLSAQDAILAHQERMRVYEHERNAARKQRQEAAEAAAAAAARRQRLRGEAAAAAAERSKRRSVPLHVAKHAVGRVDRDGRPPAAGRGRSGPGSPTALSRSPSPLGRRAASPSSRSTSPLQHGASAPSGHGGGAAAAPLAPGKAPGALIGSLAAKISGMGAGAAAAAPAGSGAAAGAGAGAGGMKPGAPAFGASKAEPAAGAGVKAAAAASKPAVHPPWGSKAASAAQGGGRASIALSRSRSLKRVQLVTEHKRPKDGGAGGGGVGGVGGGQDDVSITSKSGSRSSTGGASGSSSSSDSESEGDRKGNPSGSGSVSDVEGDGRGASHARAAAEAADSPLRGKERHHHHRRHRDKAPAPESESTSAPVPASASQHAPAPKPTPLPKAGGKHDHASKPQQPDGAAATGPASKPTQSDGPTAPPPQQHDSDHEAETSPQQQQQEGEAGLAAQASNSSSSGGGAPGLHPSRSSLRTGVPLPRKLVLPGVQGDLNHLMLLLEKLPSHRHSAPERDRERARSGRSPSAAAVVGRGSGGPAADPGGRPPSPPNRHRISVQQLQLQHTPRSVSPMGSLAALSTAAGFGGAGSGGWGESVVQAALGGFPPGAAAAALARGEDRPSAPSQRGSSLSPTISTYLTSPEPSGLLLAAMAATAAASGGGGAGSGADPRALLLRESVADSLAVQPPPEDEAEPIPLAVQVMMGFLPDDLLLLSKGQGPPGYLGAAAAGGARGAGKQVFGASAAAAALAGAGRSGSAGGALAPLKQRAGAPARPDRVPPLDLQGFQGQNRGGQQQEQLLPQEQSEPYAQSPGADGFSPEISEVHLHHHHHRHHHHHHRRHHHRQHQQSDAADSVSPRRRHSDSDVGTATATATASGEDEGAARVQDLAWKALRDRHRLPPENALPAARSGAPAAVALRDPAAAALAHSFAPEQLAALVSARGTAGPPAAAASTAAMPPLRIPPPPPAALLPAVPTVGGGGSGGGARHAGVLPGLAGARPRRGSNGIGDAPAYAAAPSPVDDFFALGLLPNPSLLRASMATAGTRANVASRRRHANVVALGGALAPSSPNLTYGHGPSPSASTATFGGVYGSLRPDRSAYGPALAAGPSSAPVSPVPSVYVHTAPHATPGSAQKTALAAEAEAMLARSRMGRLNGLNLQHMLGVEVPAPLLQAR